MKMEELLLAVHNIKTFCMGQSICEEECPFFDGKCMLSDMKRMDLQKANENVMGSAVYGYVYDDMETVTPYKDCFAYHKKKNGDEECEALNGLYCLLEPYKYCRFFKDKSEKRGGEGA